MDRYIIAEVDSENRLIHRGRLLFDHDSVVVIGSGSTGDVYAINEHQYVSDFIISDKEDEGNTNGYVAKIWRELPIPDEQVEKLRYMVRNKLTHKSQKGIVWPEFLLLQWPIQDTDEHQFDDIDIINLAMDAEIVVGYIMPRVIGAFPLYKLIDPIERASLTLKCKDMRFLYHVAMNIARAFFELHNQHHLMGDANPANMLVTTTGKILLIDCDAFQIQRNVRSFYPANKQSSGSKSITDVSAANDLVNLAILIFQLFMQGAHPFVGRNSSGIVDSATLRTQRIFPFIHPTHTPIESAPSIACLPNDIQDLCVQAFTNQPQNPPSTVTWVKTLTTIKTQLVPCAVNPEHYHIEGLPCVECDWQKQLPTSIIDI